MRAILRLHRIFWAFARRNLVLALYLDVYRRNVSSRSCSCESDNRLRARAKRLKSALEELGPSFIKLGQLLARRDDVLPPAYVEELSNLQEHAKPVPFQEIERSLGMKCICTDMSQRGHTVDPKCFHCNRVEEVFERFDRKPLATASLAQIHRGQLNGREVAIKFLKPGVLDQINLDLAILWRFRGLMLNVIGLGRSLDPNEFHSELRRSLQLEVDLQAEGLHMSLFREQNHPETTAPEVFWGFKRDDLLVMEFIQGRPLWEAAEERKKLAHRLARNFLSQVFISNLFHADPHPGNVFLRGDDIVYLDMGAMGRLDRVTRTSLQKMFYAVTRSDVEGAAESLIELGRGEELDRSTLLTDVGLIIASYGAQTGQKWSDRILATARTHQIKLPRSVILLSKALVLIESLAIQLDPQFSLAGAMREFMPQLSTATLRDISMDAHRTAEKYAGLLDRLPGLLERALDPQGVAP